MAAAKKPPNGIVDTTGWLTRPQAMDLLGCSMTSLCRWEAEGILHPEQAMRGNQRAQIVLDPTELARVPRRGRTTLLNEAGELTARVFEHLDEGRTVREIVIKTRETTIRISELRDQWLDAGGADLVINAAAKAEIERFLGPFATVAELAQRVGTWTGHTIVASVPDHATDGQIEHAILHALDNPTTTPETP